MLWKVKRPQSEHIWGHLSPALFSQNKQRRGEPLKKGGAGRTFFTSPLHPLFFLLLLPVTQFTCHWLSLVCSQGGSLVLANLRATESSRLWHKTGSITRHTEVVRFMAQFGGIVSPPFRPHAFALLRSSRPTVEDTQTHTQTYRKQNQ